MNTLNGKPLVSCVLTVPRVGVWVADLEVDTDEALTGAVALDLEGSAWTGTVARGGVELGRWRGRVVGGAGGLGAVLGPMAFADTDLRAVLTETLREAGEQLAETSAALDEVVTRWARVAGPASHTVADVARAAGHAWRVLADGSVLVGAEIWEPLALGADLDVITANPRTGRYDLAGAAALSIAPGRTVTLDGQAVRVGAVEHRLLEVALRTVVFEERVSDPANRLLAAFEGIVARATRRLDYLALRPGRVIAQSGDGGPLDIELDDPRFTIPRGITYRTLPGVALTVPVGSRVLVGFEGGDPSKPYASLWELGDVTQLVLGGGSQRAAREGDGVTASTSFDAWVNAVSTALTLTPPAGEIGTIATGSDALRLP